MKSPKRNLNISTWNVRRGLCVRENEIRNLLITEEIDVIFLTETDAPHSNAKDYMISGYSTHTQICESDGQMVRILALTKDSCGVEFKLQTNLMNCTFPSIWLEVQDKYKEKSIIGGYYRQWSAGGKLTVPEQVKQMEDFCCQINLASALYSKVIITGDANLCENKWMEDDFERKSVAKPLLECLVENGIQIQKVGLTYQADHVLANGTVPQSALDHVYSSEVIKDGIKVRTLPTSSTDHLPVIITYRLDIKKAQYKRKITKRSFKHFTKENWNESLERQDWSEIEVCTDVNQMVKIFDENVRAALDEVAPVKSFTIRSNHKFGLSDSTKDLMKKRDHTRNSIKNASGQNKTVLMQQYKSLRNKVTSQIRKETIDYNNNRIEEANNEKELWRVANEVINPKKEESDWKIKNKDGETLTDEKEVAESFNGFFIDKIENLKNKIDPNLVEDPLVKLKEKLKDLKSTLDFKTVTQKKLSNHLKKLKRKKSSGLDGLSQENLLLGTGILLAPLMSIINQSITDGEFPNEWKQAAVTPVLKKGSPEQLENYRPVSCLPAASKVLEIVICSQLSDHLETNDLLPKNQHGFRPKRSTMTAWNEIQLDWAIKSEQKQVTGVLLWDLSAAFDTLDCDGLCAKLELYGIQPRSIKWVKSFLTGRSQRVKIGSSLSSPRMVATGVPQGGVLSPLVFVLFVSDLQEWLSFSTAPTYADDTTTGTSTDKLETTISQMEADAKEVLKFMASNGLVANAKKTSLMILNCKRTDLVDGINVGEEWVPRESKAKLLGITCEDNQQWKEQINGKGGVLSSLNSRLYIIRRLKSHVSKKSILKMVDGLFTSKIRYGLQLYGKVRIMESESEGVDLKSIQLVQNKLLRLLNGTTIKDMISTRSLVEKFDMLAVNQLNAQIKLLEMWKSLNVEKYPTSITKQGPEHEGAITRADKVNRPCEVGKTTLTQKTCISDAIRLWNQAPDVIKSSATVWKAKKEIKSYVKTLPI